MINNLESEEAIVNKNMGLVVSLAKRFYNRGYDAEELIQIGTIGLLKAIRRFDEDLGMQFSTYAVPVILGEIKRFLRDDGIIKVSRTHKSNAQKIYHARERLLKLYDKEPTISELEKECNLTKEEIVTALDATQTPESLYKSSVSDDDKRELIESVPAKCKEEEILNRVMIENLMCSLSEREKKIITLRYFYDKTQSKIAEIIGVSQVQISRIEKAALLKMRGCVEEKK